MSTTKTTKPESAQAAVAAPAAAPAPAPAAEAPNPSAGGCYVRDPITGALSLDPSATTDPTPE
jgi:hypothetical protein